MYRALEIFSSFSVGCTQQLANLMNAASGLFQKKLFAKQNIIAIYITSSTDSGQERNKARLLIAGRMMQSRNEGKVIPLLN
jgi:hypothetical protein